MCSEGAKQNCDDQRQAAADHELHRKIAVGAQHVGAGVDRRRAEIRQSGADAAQDRRSGAQTG